MKRALRIALLLLGMAVALHAEEPRVASVRVEPRWPWNGLVDITCDMEGVAENRLYTFQLKGVDRERNQEVAMRTLSTDRGRTFASHADGKVEGRDGAAVQWFTWNAAKDCPALNPSSFTATVEVKVQAGTHPVVNPAEDATKAAETAERVKAQPTYLVVNLLTGRPRYTNEAPDLSGDACRTTEL